MQTLKDDASKWVHLVTVKITMVDLISLKEKNLLRQRKQTEAENRERVACKSGVWAGCFPHLHVFAVTPPPVSELRVASRTSRAATCQHGPKFCLPVSSYGATKIELSGVVYEFVLCS